MIKLRRNSAGFFLMLCVFLLSGCVTKKIIVPQPVIKYVPTPVYQEQPASKAESSTSVVESPTSKAPFYSEMDFLLKSEKLKQSQMGVYIYDLTADSVLYKYNEEQLMRPASCEKLLTAITVMKELGVNYFYKTNFYYDGKITNGILQGNLYIKGGFDPLLSKEDLTKVAMTIRNKGIKEIRGMLYTDQSLKDTLKWGKGWCWDDDNPLLSPLVYKETKSLMPIFMQELARGGVRHKPYFKERLVNGKCRLLCSVTHPLTEALTEMLKESNNLYAESMFAQLLKDTGGLYSSQDKAADYVRHFIEELGFQSDRYCIADGSGLSLYNYISPEVLAKALIYTYHKKNIFKVLYENLPIAGVDGTLEDRMNLSKTYNNVRAKTGSLSGVSTLAGYCRIANNHFVAFVIMNQGVRHCDEGRELQDRICKILVELPLK